MMLSESKIYELQSYVAESLTLLFGSKRSNEIMGHIRTIEDLKLRYECIETIVEEVVLKQDISAYADRNAWKFPPVTPTVFLLDDFYLGKHGEAYPEVVKEFAEINSGKYIETVLTGGIGSAKTTIALWTTAYQLYLLSAMQEPQRFFGLDRSSEIGFVFQSLNKSKAKELDYARFQSLIHSSPYFNEEFPYDRGIESKLMFENRIEVKPVSGADTATIGENIIGGVMDEVNFMSIVEKSKSSIDGGSYDQAQALYNSIATRRKSRFMKKGVVYGMLCLVSSKRYPGQFTDRKEAEANMQIAETGKSNIYIYDKRTWEIKPEGSFSGEWFYVFVGDTSRKPRVLDDDDFDGGVAGISEDDRHLIVRIPVEHRWEFDNDIITALRDVAGVSTLAKTPYFQDTESVAEAFGRTTSIFLTDWADFVKQKATISLANVVNKKEPRAVHIDLSKTGDSTGLAIGHIKGFKQMVRGNEVEYLPEIVVDGILEVKPPKGGEIQYWKIREILYALRDAGLNIKWVTCDSYQSTDNLQILKQKGFITGEISMDTSIRPYGLLKSAFTDRRMHCPKHDLLQLELVSLEFNIKKMKVDHPEIGVCSSKDVADAVAGMVTCLSTRRELWVKHGVPVYRMPASITETEATARVKQDEQAK